MLATTIISSGSTSAISLISEVGLPKGGLVAAIILIVLISAKEIISASKKWDSRTKASLKIAIYPLFITFILTVIYKITEII